MKMCQHPLRNFKNINYKFQNKSYENKTERETQKKNIGAITHAILFLSLTFIKLF